MNTIDRLYVGLLVFAVMKGGFVLGLYAADSFQKGDWGAIPLYRWVWAISLCLLFAVLLYSAKTGENQ